MTTYGYTLMTEQSGLRELVGYAAAAEQAGSASARGRNLNEHVVGWGWPPANVGHERSTRSSPGRPGSPRPSCCPPCARADAAQRPTTGAHAHSTTTASTSAGGVTRAPSTWKSRAEGWPPRRRRVRRHSRFASEPV